MHTHPHPQHIHTATHTHTRTHTTLTHLRTRTRLHTTPTTPNALSKASSYAHPQSHNRSSSSNSRSIRPTPRHSTTRWGKANRRYQFSSLPSCQVSLCVCVFVLSAHTYAHSGRQRMCKHLTRLVPLHNPIRRRSRRKHHHEFKYVTERKIGQV